jgi:hypothetical protein
MGMFEKGRIDTITGPAPVPEEPSNRVISEDDRKFRPTRGKAAKKRKRKLAKASQRRNRKK